MSVTDHAPIALPRTTDPGSSVADRTAEAPDAPMDGSSGGTRMISETGDGTRPWIVEYVA